MLSRIRSTLQALVTRAKGARNAPQSKGGPSMTLMQQIRMIRRKRRW